MKGEPEFTNKAFDFYGGYTRITDDQKYKYAETQVTMFYKDLCDELVKKNQTQMIANKLLTRTCYEYSRQSDERDQRFDYEKNLRIAAENHAKELE